MERITDLTAPPIVGKRYLVPTVNHPWLSYSAPAWPVFLPLHNDERFFNFVTDHYHIDPRFISERLFKAAGAWRIPRFDAVGPAQLSMLQFQSQPLARHNYGAGDVPLPGIVWRARRCSRDAAPYMAASAPAVLRLNDHFAGQTALRNRAGWVCPHQRAALGSIMPSSDGVITCPLHGLRFRASDGLCLPSVQIAPPIEVSP